MDEQWVSNGRAYRLLELLLVLGSRLAIDAIYPYLFFKNFSRLNPPDKIVERKSQLVSTHDLFMFSPLESQHF
jgi:hypothetical protein